MTAEHVVRAAREVRDQWRVEPVGNTPAWHAVILALIQTLDEYDDDRAASRARP